MKKALFIVALIFLLVACDKAPRERENAFDSKTLFPGRSDTEIAGQNIEEKPAPSVNMGSLPYAKTEPAPYTKTESAPYTKTEPTMSAKPEPFAENRKEDRDDTPPGRMHSRDATTILDEVESILYEGEAGEASMKSAVAKALSVPDALKLKADINAALRGGGLTGVTAEVDDALNVTLKGTVGCVEEKSRAFDIAMSIADAGSLRDLVFVVEEKEDRI